MAPPDELTRRQIIGERLQMLVTSAETEDDITRMAMDVVNATPAILLDLCDQLAALLAGRGVSGGSCGSPTDPTRSVLCSLNLLTFCLIRCWNKLPVSCSRAVSVLDSGAEGPGFESQPRRCGVTVLGKLFTPIVPLFTKQRNW